MVEGALSCKTFIQVQNFYAGYEINAAKTSLKPQTKKKRNLKHGAVHHMIGLYLYQIRKVKAQIHNVQNMRMPQCHVCETPYALIDKGKNNGIQSRLS